MSDSIEDEASDGDVAACRFESIDGSAACGTHRLPLKHVASLGWLCETSGVIFPFGTPFGYRISAQSAALAKLFDAYQELKRLGWNDAIYCPKDGTWFDVIEIGSTGIHKCHYQGEWPNGHWWVAEHGDLWPSRPVLFRERKKRSEPATSDDAVARTVASDHEPPTRA